MRINTNVSSLNAWRNLTVTDLSMSKNLERLSSGFRINRAADDAAGLAVSEKMRAQIRGINQAVRNAQDGISLVQTAEGALTETHSMLQRMRELAVQAGNDTLQSEDRTQIQSEMDQLAREISRITNATQFNAKDLINGAMQKSNASGYGGISDLTLQIGPNNGQTLSFSIGAMDASTLGISRDVMTAKVFDRVAGTNEATTDATLNGDVLASVAATGAVGAGLAAGEYVVKYDNTNNTVQLFDATGANAIGVQAEFKAGEEVTIGDVNTGRTVTVQLASSAPAGASQDRLLVGSRIAAATELAAGQTVLDTTATGGGISNVGWGLESGSYGVAVVAVGAGWGIQLQDSAGNALGGAQAYTGAGTYDIGDKTTGRTLSVTVKGALAAPANDTITVTNNGQGAYSAQFYGGAKAADANSWAGLNVMSATAANDALTKIDTAINNVSNQRAQLGSIQNRLEHTINNLQVVSENLSASESRVRDVDMALEMTHFTKNQILTQAGAAMLAQANAKTQAVLSLLR